VDELDQYSTDLGRLAHLREHLAALESYGNGGGQRAATARAEITQIEARVAGDADPEPPIPPSGAQAKPTSRKAAR
jgi:hypothetical protein